MSKFYWLNPHTRKLEHISEWPKELPRSEIDIKQMSNKQIDEMIKRLLWNKV